MDKKLAEEKVREMLASLTPEQLAELQNSFAESIDKIKAESVEKLETLKIEKERLEAEKKALGSEYGNWDKKQELIKSIEIIGGSILNQQNIVKALENNGLIGNVTDENGFEYKDVPDFRKVDTSEFTFDEKTVLTSPIPKYVPFINEEKFKGHGYVFDAIRVTEDSYMVCLGNYSRKEKEKNNFFIATLDQLVLIIDYYYAKAKAKNAEEARLANERSKERYFALPEASRRSYMFQRGIYRSLSASEKKKVSEAEFEAMDLEEREKHYLPIKIHGVKRLTSKLGESQMWISFHNMYEDFIDKTKTLLDKNGNPDPSGRYANPTVMQYWRDFAEMINYKLKDIKIQREDYSDTYKQAIETSFGESNVDTILKEKYGILVKRQNGDKIKPVEVDLIEKSWVEIQKVYGNLKAEAIKHNLKISHSGEKLMFAMKALGVYIPQMGTIGVSNKLGEVDFKSTFSHETAHFIDNFIGELNGKRWATDNYESLAGKIAFTFRNSMNKNKKDQTDYINATKECFARAMQQYFVMKTYGEEAVTLNVDLKEFPEGVLFIKHPNFVNQFTFKSDIEPMIEQFFKENLDVFETTVDIDGTNDLAPITEEEAEIQITDEDLKPIEEIVAEVKPIKIVYFEDYMNWLKSKGKNPKYKKVEDGLYEFDEHINFRYNNLDKANFKFVTTKGDKFYYRDIEIEKPKEEPKITFINTEYGITYIVEKDDKGVWTVFSESKDWAKRNEYPSGFASKEDAISIAKLEAGVEKEVDPEEVFMRNELENEPQEESIQDLIDGLQILVDVSEGEEKQELEDTIEGLKLLL